MDEFLQIKTYLTTKPVSKAAIFGSFARGEHHQKSDIDVLVETNGLTLFDILKMEEELENITHRKIDFVEYKAVKPSLRSHIFANLVQLI